MVLQSNQHSPPVRDGINREYVVAVALSIIDRTGLESLSIRRLASSIHRDPMTVYRYVPTKQALLDAVADSVLDTLITVDSADPDWQRQLGIFARHYRALALEHPNAAVLLATRPRSTPLGLGTRSTLTPLESILKLLIDSGYTVPEAISGYRCLLSFLRGHILSEAQESVERPDDTADRRRIATRRLPSDQFPMLSALPPIVAEYDGARELEYGLETLVRGLNDILHGTGQQLP
ncbi:TetR/AcrR family transcriptional regulator C-terminal domain-containing protein [Rhodococcus sp. IEGM1428]|uniref:TetR/AcrR family transcriptional regulator C-terminal domain-containing protein n=1 Tax=Rhodococcus sp. IEGM1428 TaxID=3392191 RepID=UPI003D0C173A